MKYPDFLDTFPYADNASITGLTSETGHIWAGSGANLPQIVSNTLTSSGAVGGGGNYCYVDVMQPPAYQYVDVAFNDAAAGLVLISSFLDNLVPELALTRMTHFRFTVTALSLQMRGLGDASPGTPSDVSDPTIEYASALTLGQTYRIGVRYLGERFIIDMPDGTQYKFAHKKFSDQVGRYLCYQPLSSSISKAGCVLQQRQVITL